MSARVGRVARYGFCLALGVAAGLGAVGAIWRTGFDAGSDVTLCVQAVAIDGGSAMDGEFCRDARKLKGRWDWELFRRRRAQ